MTEPMSTQESQLCEYLKAQPRRCKNRYDKNAQDELIESLFWFLAGGRPEYLRLFFPDKTKPPSGTTWKLRTAQGGADGDEFTEAARGKACGHIFKSGEATYRCKTCSTDDTCVLCARCYDSSDHTGHMVYINVSMGNSGCCDCGDPEAWRLPVHCTIHTSHEGTGRDKGKALMLPSDLIEAIQMTVGRAFDYICDVISCSPEKLRSEKTKQTILDDERKSRLTSNFYDGDIIEEPCEYALLLWNDEKHTVTEVKEQVARACKVTAREALKRAHETDAVGRSIVKYGYDVDELLKVSKIIEHIKVTVTIRSARDTFREQMCGTIIQWLNDIAGCSVGDDHNILRQVICEEMLKNWTAGSAASNADVGMKGLDDHEVEDGIFSHRHDLFWREVQLRQAAQAAQAATDEAGSEDDDDDVEGIDDGDFDGDIDFDDAMAAVMGMPSDDEDAGSDYAALDAEFDRPMAASQTQTDADGDIEMGTGDRDTSPMEESEATIAGYPPPPPPPPAPVRPIRDRDVSPSDSDTAEMQPLISRSLYTKSGIEIPRTPGKALKTEVAPKPPRYWLETPKAFTDTDAVPPYENLQHRLRLDWMVLFDLRMWKQVRIDLRDLYISTVVVIPEFKRILGLRFAGLYTLLAQLYLIADREPDHSIINISLQMLTTPTITAEIVERGNFLTNLMAILYTYLTTRQVDHPYEIDPNATLAFDSGTATNRRMYHFFMDLRYLFSSSHVQQRLRTDERYILQFLDLVKLHQGICPNTRATGEHVEYETDVWISASLITREINRLCRQFSEAFKIDAGEDPTQVAHAIRLTAKTVILNSLGCEKQRFRQAEIKDDAKFKRVGDYEFENTSALKPDLKHIRDAHHNVIRYDVQSQPISFHHALHYTLSWLIECGKHMSREQMAQLLSFSETELYAKPRAMGLRHTTATSASHDATDYLMAAFDYPLRVCAWLAQMKAGMWVRNGMSLRHQMGTYRGVAQRDVSYHRDIFLLQTALVVCPPSRVLVTMIDRFGLESWMKGLYEHIDGLEDAQTLDVVEDMIHLLIILASDRTSLASNEEEGSPHILAMRKDITHVLCFKPLSFQEICAKLPDKFQDQEECQDILDEMTVYKAPEGLSDVGTFELKEQFLDDIDPYNAHYNKNQREESENAYKAWMAKKTGRPISDIVFEPRIRPLESGVFQDLSAFTRTGAFAQIIYYSLLYPLKAKEFTPNVPATRLEIFLQVVLHLVLIAISEDHVDELSDDPTQSFVYRALTSNARANFFPNRHSWRTIAAVLEMLSREEDYKSCHPKISLVLRRMKQKQPRNFETAFVLLGVPTDRISTASPAVGNILEERERKKQAALARQAKVMAQFQQQQKNFLDKQGDIDWGEDELGEEMEEEEQIGVQKSYWQYPASTCILCQEETKDGRLYGTFAMMTKSTILRQTDFQDPDFMREAAKSPESLDISADCIRPCGVSGENREQVRKVNSTGAEIITERQVIGKGFSPNMIRSGPVSVGCGHIMHYKCFEVYCEASRRRHTSQVARHHPEILSLNEFVCPLCKALGNAFLPIIWNAKEEIPQASLEPSDSFDDFLQATMLPSSKSDDISVSEAGAQSSKAVDIFVEHDKSALVSSLSSNIPELLIDAWEPIIQTPDLMAPLIHPAGGAIIAVGLNITGQAAAPVSSMHELADIYSRLHKTIAENKISNTDSVTPSSSKRARAESGELRSSDTLAQMLGFSISAVEIQQRGVANVTGKFFLDNLPQNAVTHLRILAETAASYVSIGGIRAAGDNALAREFSAAYERQQAQLFLRTESDVRSYPSLLSQDIFVFLTEASLCLSTVEAIPIMHLVQLCYVAEITKVVLKLGRNKGSSNYMETMGFYEPKNLNGLQNFCAKIYSHDRDTGITEDGPNTGLSQPCFNSAESILAFVKKYALVFLRKTALLLQVRHGVVLNSGAVDGDASELDRLTEAMKLPKLEQLCTWLLHDPNIGALIKRWIVNSKAQDTEKLSVSHPAIFELIGLPKNYDTLMEETMKRRCPTTGKEVSDPVLCLFCGVITCGQSICCLAPGPPDRTGKVSDIGGAQRHMLRLVLFFHSHVSIMY